MSGSCSGCSSLREDLVYRKEILDVLRRENEKLKEEIERLKADKE